MEIIELIKAVLIGIVQGITEWLPVSSTGHMILFDEFVKLDVSAEFMDFFLVSIQLGSILAVLVLFFSKLNPFSRKKTKDEQRATYSLWLHIIVGCMPAAVIGVLFEDQIDALFDQSGRAYAVVAIALLVYGVAFIVIEHLRDMKKAPDRIAEAEKIGYRDALLIGCFQVLALIPGTSRSGSTVLGACLLGVSRPAAAEFSFFMAMPVMAGASLLKGVKFLSAGGAMTTNEIGVLIVGTVTAFVVSLVAIRFLMDFVRRHSFAAFGWYRIALGAAVLLYFGVSS